MRYDPFQHAEDLGLRVEWGDPGPGIAGLYEHHSLTITLSAGLSPRAARCVLAHEIVHHEYGDEPTMDAVWHAKRERRCNRIAAARLVDDDEFAAAVAASEDPGQWCLDLSVTSWILKAYMAEQRVMA